MAKTIRVLRMPNGRELRQLEDLTWEVQPPADNYWLSGETAQAALEAAGWGDLRADSLEERSLT